MLCKNSATPSGQIGNRRYFYWKIAINHVSMEFSHLQIHPMGQNGPTVRPVLAHGQYAWHPCVKAACVMRSSHGLITINCDFGSLRSLHVLSETEGWKKERQKRGSSTFVFMACLSSPICPCLVFFTLYLPFSTAAHTQVWKHREPNVCQELHVLPFWCKHPFLNCYTGEPDGSLSVLCIIKMSSLHYWQAVRRENRWDTNCRWENCHPFLYATFPYYDNFVTHFFSQLQTASTPVLH